MAKRDSHVVGLLVPSWLALMSEESVVHIVQSLLARLEESDARIESLEATRLTEHDVEIVAL